MPGKEIAVFPTPRPIGSAQMNQRRSDRKRQADQNVVAVCPLSQEIPDRFTEKRLRA